jgi:DNA adenine methylase
MLLKWTGGKESEIVKFKQYYPRNFNVFVEPFCGGASVLFELNFKNNVINDLNKELMTFYKMIKDGRGKEIFDKMKDTPNDEETFYYMRDVFSPKEEIDIAYRFYYLRKTCFRGLVRYNKSGGFNAPYGNYKTLNCDDLLNPHYQKVLSNTKLFNKDYNEIFDQYDSESCFYFIDCPYDGTFNDYNSSAFGNKEQIQLSMRIKTTKAKCLLVIMETDFIKDLYKGMIIDRYSKDYKMNSKNKKNEKFHLVISNRKV